MNDRMESAFSPRLMRKVLGWGFGAHGWRVCHSCKIKAKISLERVAEWIKGAPDCQRCQGPTELMREDQTPKLAEYRAVIPSASKQSQHSTKGLRGAELVTSEDPLSSRESGVTLATEGETDG